MWLFVMCIEGMKVNMNYLDHLKLDPNNSVAPHVTWCDMLGPVPVLLYIVLNALNYISVSVLLYILLNAPNHIKQIILFVKYDWEAIPNAMNLVILGNAIIHIICIC